MMQAISPKKMLLRDVRHVWSPNQSERPPATVINLLVVHCISLPPGTFEVAHIDELFTNRLDPNAHPYFATVAANPVSAHVLIDREGKLTQYVDFEQRAWHAGQSSFEGQQACNDYSIGVELLGSEYHPFTESQYNSLCILTRTLQKVYPAITRERITGHSEIAPGRKTDPGPHFDWEHFFSLLNRDTSLLSFE
jgi:AmpD protein